MGGHLIGLSNLDTFNSVFASPHRDITWSQISTATDGLIFGRKNFNQRILARE
jgi:hypothetical protein